MGVIYARSANWDVDGDGMLYASESQYDMALLGLRSGAISASAGWLGVSNSPADFSGRAEGYPTRGTGLMEQTVFADASSELRGVRPGFEPGPRRLRRAAAAHGRHRRLCRGRAVERQLRLHPLDLCRPVRPRQLDLAHPRAGRGQQRDAGWSGRRRNTPVGFRRGRDHLSGHDGCGFDVSEPPPTKCCAATPATTGSTGWTAPTRPSTRARATAIASSMRTSATPWTTCRSAATGTTTWRTWNGRSSRTCPSPWASATCRARSHPIRSRHSRSSTWPSSTGCPKPMAWPSGCRARRAARPSTRRPMRSMPQLCSTRR